VDLSLARLNLISSVPYEGKFDFLLNCLQKKARITIYNYNWRVLDARLIVVPGTKGSSFVRFITGTLIRYKDDQETIFDEDRGEVNYELVKDKVFGMVNFFIKDGHYLIAHQESPRVRENMFRKTLAAVIEEAERAFFVSVDINPIVDRRDFIARIKSLDMINNIFLTLHPSNPKYQDRWKDVDDELQSTNVGTLAAKYVPKKDKGIKIPETSRLMKSLLMIADGYGRALIKGRKDDSTAVVTSAARPVKLSIPHEEEHPFMLSLKDSMEQAERELDEDNVRPA
jgi:hypothetical protein